MVIERVQFRPLFSRDAKPGLFFKPRQCLIKTISLVLPEVQINTWVSHVGPHTDRARLVLKTTLLVLCKMEVSYGREAKYLFLLLEIPREGYIYTFLRMKISLSIEGVLGELIGHMCSLSAVLTYRFFLHVGGVDTLSPEVR